MKSWEIFSMVGLIFVFYIPFFIYVQKRSRIKFGRKRFCRGVISTFENCTDDNNCIIESEGIKTMLKGLIWGHIAEVFDTTLATVGVKKNDSANSENAGLQVSRMYNLFNQQVKTYRAIQWFICENSSDYPEENMQPIKLATWL